jgi:acyl-coenzyme A thioesterase PaaI-like protein
LYSALFTDSRKEEEALPVEERRIDLPGLEGHFCFACGTANPIGLKLKFYNMNDNVCADITLGRNHEGWQNMAHGGIITTLLDEVMAWTIMYFKRIFFVTRKMEVKYVRPVMVGVPLTVKGRLMKERKPPYIGVIADILDDERRILARGTGEFVEIPRDKLDLVPEGPKQDMVELYDKFEKSF